VPDRIPRDPPPRPLLAAVAVAAVSTLLLTASCARRVAIYSPRIDNTADHAAAKTPADCLRCHGGDALPAGHAASEPCLGCHKTTPGVTP
jgi:hypothetical protein